jgi:hypothetical protein
MESVRSVSTGARIVAHMIHHCLKDLLLYKTGRSASGAVGQRLQRLINSWVYLIGGQRGPAAPTPRRAMQLRHEQGTKERHHPNHNELGEALQPRQIRFAKKHARGPAANANRSEGDSAKVDEGQEASHWGSNGELERPGTGASGASLGVYS